jgi:hypothetical protein
VMDTKSNVKENEDNKKEKLEEEEYIDWEVKLEVELISALEEIDKLGENNRKKKEKL